MKRSFCYLYLSCKQGDEEKIARALLDKKLVACAKFIPIESMYWWKGQVEKASEMLIMFESATDLYSQIEAEVAKIHSYDTFVLAQVPLTNINASAAGWLNDNLVMFSPKTKLV